MNFRNTPRVAIEVASHRISKRLALVAALLLAPFTTGAAPAEALAEAAKVEWQWGVRIPLRDGVRLNATLYRPAALKEPRPCLFTLTPYIGQSYHDRGMYFAAHGYPFLTVDVRGRGNSEGSFRPLIQEAKDGYDVVEWLAKQPYCNGKISMWGGSYAGYDQWVTATEFPPHLATIVPVASPAAGVDFPARNNSGQECRAVGSSPGLRTAGSIASLVIHRRFFRSGSVTRTLMLTGILIIPLVSNTANCRYPY
jgi:pimeloyl-ACP methyl ester carboxylesterase